MRITHADSELRPAAEHPGGQKGHDPCPSSRAAKNLPLPYNYWIPFIFLWFWRRLSGVLPNSYPVVSKAMHAPFSCTATFTLLRRKNLFYIHSNDEAVFQELNR
jgi:hypothetical protein